MQALQFAPHLRILRLGKWGGRELGLHSDLDFVFVSDNEESHEEEQKKLRRFLNLMQSTYRAGRLYSIDMRLRPTGSAGPFLIAESRLQKYLEEQAAAWERQAYLKASYIDDSLLFAKSSWLDRGLSNSDRLELKSIRERLLTHRESDKLDLKFSAGGLLHIELVCQEYVLWKRLVSSHTDSLGLLNDVIQLQPQTQPLVDCYLQLRKVEQMLQLVRHHNSTLIQREKDGPWLKQISLLCEQDFSFDCIHQTFIKASGLIEELLQDE